MTDEVSIHYVPRPESYSVQLSKSIVVNVDGTRDWLIHEQIAKALAEEIERLKDRVNYLEKAKNEIK